MNKSSDDHEYEVGYGKPPKEHQFKKGNKAAAGKRKRKAPQKVRAMLAKLMNEKVAVLVDGKTVRMPRIEALSRRLINDAGKSSRDTLQLLKLIDDLGIDEYLDEQADSPAHKIVVEFVGEQVTPVHDTCGTGDIENDL